MDDLIEALEIFKKYVEPESYKWDNPFHCEHDTLSVTAIDPSDVSDVDKMRLDQLGFFEDGESDNMKSYRFGSS